MGDDNADGALGEHLDGPPRHLLPIRRTNLFAEPVEHGNNPDRPVVLEAVTDPSVPPLPPHITIDQAKALTSSLLAGDPDAKDIMKQSFKQKVEEFLPGR